MPTVTERFVADFHDSLPGGSSLAFGALAVDDVHGQRHASPYHALLDRLQAAEAELLPGPLLDLARGDGHLLALLASAAAGGRTHLGVDFSAGELTSARTRLGGELPLYQARAQALPLADASVAVITCHMALMLMAEPEAVVGELRRVLRPGGRLLAVVPAAAMPEAPPDPLTAAFGAALTGHARHAEWQAVRFETRRWRDPASLRALLQAAFLPPRFTRLTGTQALTPDAAWAWFSGLYDLHLSPPAAWPAIAADFRRRLLPLLDDRGLAALPHSFFLIDATAAS
ncbi:MAG: class I SAM-dependent methyltransferase [Microbacteriaceae bacterium]|nr:class I SAM-dependent methyltransferase [Burkholderiaceae bacterium]